MSINEIEKLLSYLNTDYDILYDTIIDFIEEPTTKNKKKVMEANKTLNCDKVKLIHRISDFWCKGE